MTRPEKYVPKHRAPGAHKRKRDPWGALRTSARSSVALTGIAAVATAGIVAVGVFAGGEDEALVAGVGAGNAGASLTTATTERLADRDEPVSRSDRRAKKDPVKAAALSTEVGVVTTHSREVSMEDPRAIARALLGEFGFADSQFNCLDMLWIRESNWRWNADNPTSSAYGIPQALPGSKMATAGADWETNPETQIRWGLGYIKNRYGSPCAAWDHSQRVGWY